jgi:hypothetical protein
MGRDFSGSCGVTSRNRLIHIQITHVAISCYRTGYKAVFLRSKSLSPYRTGEIATANFREYPFHAVSILENGCGRRLGSA